MLDELNQGLFLSINGIANKVGWLDNLAILSAEYLPFAFIGVLLYLWFADKPAGKESSLYSGYTVLLALSISWVIGIFYYHSRPFVDGLGTTLITHGPDASFPSDHATFLVSIALTLALIKETRKLGMTLCLFAAIGGFARVVCGVHYPFDILGSLLTSSVASFTVLYFRNRLTTLNQFIINTYDQLMNMANLKSTFVHHK
jgi:undecaprenyl-diphosphatase